MNSGGTRVASCSRFGGLVVVVAGWMAILSSHCSVATIFIIGARQFNLSCTVAAGVSPDYSPLETVAEMAVSRGQL